MCIRDRDLAAVRIIGVSVIAGCPQGESWLYRRLTEINSRYYGLSLMRTPTRGPYSVRYKGSWLYSHFFVKGVLHFLTARKCHILWLTISTICTLSAWNEKHDDSPLTWLYEYTKSQTNEHCGAVSRLCSEICFSHLYSITEPNDPLLKY